MHQLTQLFKSVADSMPRQDPVVWEIVLPVMELILLGELTFDVSSNRLATVRDRLANSRALDLRGLVVGGEYRRGSADYFEELNLYNIVLRAKAKGKFRFQFQTAYNFLFEGDRSWFTKETKDVKDTIQRFYDSSGFFEASYLEPEESAQKRLRGGMEPKGFEEDTRGEFWGVRIGRGKMKHQLYTDEQLEEMNRWNSEHNYPPVQQVLAPAPVTQALTGWHMPTQQFYRDGHPLTTSDVTEDWFRPGWLLDQERDSRRQSESLANTVWHNAMARSARLEGVEEEEEEEIPEVD